MTVLTQESVFPMYVWHLMFHLCASLGVSVHSVNRTVNRELGGGGVKGLASLLETQSVAPVSPGCVARSCPLSNLCLGLPFD